MIPKKIKELSHHRVIWNEGFREGQKQTLEEVLEIHKKLSGEIGSWMEYDKKFSKQIKQKLLGGEDEITLKEGKKVGMSYLGGKDDRK
jgi:hypothetical protein